MLFRSLAKHNAIPGLHVVHNFPVFNSSEMYRIKKRITDFEDRLFTKRCWPAQIKFQPVGRLTEAKTRNCFVKNSPLSLRFVLYILKSEIAVFVFKAGN